MRQRIAVSNSSLIILLVIISATSAALLTLPLSTVVKGICGTISCASAFALATMLCPASFLTYAVTPPTAVLGFTVFYYALGLTPLSVYRDNLDVNAWTLRCILAVAGFGIGLFLGQIFLGRITMNMPILSIPIFEKLLLLNILLSVGCASYLIFTNGSAILSPDSRHEIGGVIPLLLESQVFTWTFLPLIHPLNTTRGKLLFCVSLATSIVAGYRNILALLIIVACWGRMIIYIQTDPTKAKKLVAAVTLGLMVFMGGAYLFRTERSERLLDFESAIAIHEIKGATIVTPLIPLHLYSREGLGVADTAYKRRSEIFQYGSPTELYFSGILTALPNFDLTLGRVLGRVVNRSEISLTMSLAGAITVCFDTPWILPVHVIIGAVIGYLWCQYQLRPSIGNLGASVLFASYYIALTIRGFPKFSMVVALFYIIIAAFFVQPRPVAINSDQGSYQ